MDASDIDRPISVTEKRVYCDGGVSLGHPGVYINLDANGRAICPYCSQAFVLAEGARPGAHH